MIVSRSRRDQLKVDLVSKLGEFALRLRVAAENLVGQESEEISGAKGLDKFLRKSLFLGDPVKEFDGCLRRLAPRLLLRDTIGEAFAAARVGEASERITAGMTAP